MRVVSQFASSCGVKPLKALDLRVAKSGSFACAPSIYDWELECLPKKQETGDVFPVSANLCAALCKAEEDIDI